MRDGRVFEYWLGVKLVFAARPEVLLGSVVYFRRRRV